MSGRISVFRGFVDWGSNIEELLSPADYYESSEVLKWQGPAGLGCSGPRAALVQNLCQNASGASYYCRMAADYRPGPKKLLSLELAVPQDEMLGLGDIARPLYDYILNQLQGGQGPAGQLRFCWGRFHPVDSRMWAYQAAARSLLHLFCPKVDWPPDQLVAQMVSQQFRQDSVVRPEPGKSVTP